MGQKSKYYGIRFDRRSQNFGFHMIARSQLIADDRRRSQNFLRSAIRDPRSSAIIWKPALRAKNSDLDNSDFFDFSTEKSVLLSKMKCKDYYLLFQEKSEVTPTAV